jgi:hypothetical protein
MKTHPTNKQNTTRQIIATGLDDYRRTGKITESLYTLYDQSGNFMRHGHHAELAEKFLKDTCLSPDQLTTTAPHGELTLRTSFFCMNRHKIATVPYHHIKGDFYSIFCPEVIATSLKTIEGDAEILTDKIDMPRLESVSKLTTTDLPELFLPELKTAKEIFTGAVQVKLPQLERITERFSALGSKHVNLQNLRHIPCYPYTGEAEVIFHPDLQDYFQWEYKQGPKRQAGLAS